MKKLNNVKKAELEEVVTTVSKILIHTMTQLELKTHIEMTSVSDGNRYVLRFEKEKI